MPIALRLRYATQPGKESVPVEFEEDLSVAIGLQGTIDRLLELVQGMHYVRGPTDSPSARRGRRSSENNCRMGQPFAGPP